MEKKTFKGLLTDNFVIRLILSGSMALLIMFIFGMLLKIEKREIIVQLESTGKELSINPNNPDSYNGNNIIIAADNLIYNEETNRGIVTIDGVDTSTDLSILKLTSNIVVPIKAKGIDRFFVKPTNTINTADLTNDAVKLFINKMEMQLNSVADNNYIFENTGSHETIDSLELKYKGTNEHKVQTQILNNAFNFFELKEFQIRNNRAVEKWETLYAPTYLSIKDYNLLLSRLDEENTIILERSYTINPTGYYSINSKIKNEDKTAIANLIKTNNIKTDLANIPVKTSYIMLAIEKNIYNDMTEPDLLSQMNKRLFINGEECSLSYTTRLQDSFVLYYAIPQSLKNNAKHGNITINSISYISDTLINTPAESNLLQAKHLIKKSFEFTDEQYSEERVWNSKTSIPTSEYLNGFALSFDSKAISESELGYLKVFLSINDSGLIEGTLRNEKFYFSTTNEIKKDLSNITSAKIIINIPLTEFSKGFADRFTKEELINQLAVTTNFYDQAKIKADIKRMTSIETVDMNTPLDINSQIMNINAVNSSDKIKKAVIVGRFLNREIELPIEPKKITSNMGVFEIKSSVISNAAKTIDLYIQLTTLLIFILIYLLSSGTGQKINNYIRSLSPTNIIVRILISIIFLIVIGSVLANPIKITIELEHLNKNGSMVVSQSDGRSTNFNQLKFNKKNKLSDSFVVKAPFKISGLNIKAEKGDLTVAIKEFRMFYDIASIKKEFNIVRFNKEQISKLFVGNIAEDNTNSIKYNISPNDMIYFNRDLTTFTGKYRFIIILLSLFFVLYPVLMFDQIIDALKHIGFKRKTMVSLISYKLTINTIVSGLFFILLLFITLSSLNINKFVIEIIKFGIILIIGLYGMWFLIFDRLLYNTKHQRIDFTIIKNGYGLMRSNIDKTINSELKLKTTTIITLILMLSGFTVLFIDIKDPNTKTILSIMLLLSAVLIGKNTIFTFFNKIKSILLFLTLTVIILLIDLTDNNIKIILIFMLLVVSLIMNSKSFVNIINKLQMTNDDIDPIKLIILFCGSVLFSISYNPIITLYKSNKTFSTVIIVLTIITGLIMFIFNKKEIQTTDEELKEKNRPDNENYENNSNENQIDDKLAKFKPPVELSLWYNIKLLFKYKKNK